MLGIAVMPIPALQMAPHGRFRSRRPNDRPAPRPSWRPRRRRIFVEIPLAFPVASVPSASKSLPVTAQFAGNRLRYARGHAEEAVSPPASF